MDTIKRQTPVNLEDFSKKSLEYYEQIKEQLKKETMGKFVALDYETSQYWLGETASETLEKAKKQFPEKLFYLLQIGFPSTFSVKQDKSYGFIWPH